MDFWSLVLAVALLCSLPAGLVLLGVLAHRPSSASWIATHARLFGVVAAGAWASLLLRTWLGPSEPSVFGALLPVVGLVAVVAFSMARTDRGAARS